MLATDLNKGIFWIFLFMYFIQHFFICCPSDSTVSEDAGIEPRTVATSALAVRRSSHSASSPPTCRDIPFPKEDQNTDELAGGGGGRGAPMRFQTSIAYFIQSHGRVYSCVRTHLSFSTIYLFSHKPFLPFIINLKETLSTFRSNRNMQDRLCRNSPYCWFRYEVLCLYSTALRTHWFWLSKLFRPRHESYRNIYLPSAHIL